MGAGVVFLYSTFLLNLLQGKTLTLFLNLITKVHSFTTCDGLVSLLSHKHTYRLLTNQRCVESEEVRARFSV